LYLLSVKLINLSKSIKSLKNNKYLIAGILSAFAAMPIKDDSTNNLENSITSENIFERSAAALALQLSEGSEAILLEENENIYTIDVSDHFIPEILSASEHGNMYLFDINELNQLFGEDIFETSFDRERYGIYSTFEHHISLLRERIQHYQSAIERRGERRGVNENLFIDYTETIEHDFTTERTAQRIEELLSIDDRTERQEARLQNYLERIEIVRNIQTILSWENFYNEEINGVYSHIIDAVRTYQQFHNIDSDGRVGSVTRDLLNTTLEEHFNNSDNDILNVFRERVFHATYVINDEELDRITMHAAEQLEINTPLGALEFFEHGRNEGEFVEVELDVPDLYLQEDIDIRIEITKSTRNRINTRLDLYGNDEQGNEELMFSTRAVVGGEHLVRGRRRNFPTPTGEFYLRRVILFPRWFPPSWAEETYGEPITVPGFQNAFGIMASPLNRNEREQDDPYAARYSGDLPYLLHMTNSPGSVESGRGRSHGCIRVHPNLGNHIFYFMIHFTPHMDVGDAEYKGENVPFLRSIHLTIRENE